MTLVQLKDSMKLKSLWDGWDDDEISGGYTSDLLSDVMANAAEGEVLITIQAHKNTVAVATLKDLSALLIASNRPIPEDMVKAARDEGIPIFVSTDNQFTCSWKLQKALNSK